MVGDAPDPSQAAANGPSDDTCVAILEKHDRHVPGQPAAVLHLHEKTTADNSDHGGIHPIVALRSHQENLAKLVASALHRLPNEAGHAPPSAACTLSVRAADGSLQRKQLPDFITVTRGPGMRSCLDTGLDTAKGLAAAWQIPLLAVNHMQAHALTPRLVAALEPSSAPEPTPCFPFLSLLVSGGHTMLLHSRALCDHALLASTSDIALGDALDKIARVILPAGLLARSQTGVYGPQLQSFAFPPGAAEPGYQAPAHRAEAFERRPTAWGWTLNAPLTRSRAGSKSNSMEYTFCGTESAVRHIVEARGAKMDEEERRALAREAMTVLFEHVASRVVMALQATENKRPRPRPPPSVDTLVVSGGVAANEFLREVYRRPPPWPSTPVPMLTPPA